jgi:hypothetical protein
VNLIMLSAATQRRVQCQTAKAARAPNVRSYSLASSRLALCHRRDASTRCSRASAQQLHGTILPMLPKGSFIPS